MSPLQACTPENYLSNFYPDYTKRGNAACSREREGMTRMGPTAAASFSDLRWREKGERLKKHGRRG